MRKQRGATKWETTIPGQKTVSIGCRGPENLLKNLQECARLEGNGNTSLLIRSILSNAVLRRLNKLKHKPAEARKKLRAKLLLEISENPKR